MNVSSCIDRRFSVVIKNGDEICHLRRNKSSEFLTLCQCLHVQEEKYGMGNNFCRKQNFMFESENPAMKVFKLFSIIEGQGGYIRLNITIHPSKVRITQMDKSEVYSPYQYLMSMSADKCLGLICYGGFFTIVISHFH